MAVPSAFHAVPSEKVACPFTDTTSCCADVLQCKINSVWVGADKSRGIYVQKYPYFCA